MPRYKNQFGQTVEVGSPELNPELVAGLTPLPDTGVITPDMLTPQTPIDIPSTPTDTTNYSGLIAGGNAALMESFKNLFPAPSESLADLYATESKSLETPSADVVAKQTAFTTAKNKLTSINAELSGLATEQAAVPIQMQEDILGRGVTKAGLAPLEAGALRKIALRALPLQARAYGAQAEALAAQGDLENSQSVLKLAQDKLSTAFELKQKDAEAQYQYRKDIQDKIWTYLTDKEKTRLADLKTTQAQEFQTQQNNLNNAQALSTKAMENGQADLAAKITQLDSQSPTFVQDLAKLQAQIKIKPKSVPVSVETHDIGIKNLASVGLKPNVIGEDNKLTSANADKIIAAGVDRNVVESITKDIVAGNNLDKIRNDLATIFGKDAGFRYLDTYMQTLQKDAGTDLDSLLNQL